MEPSMPICPNRLPALIVALTLGWAAPPALAQQGVSGPFLAAKVAISNSDFRAADQWFQRALTLQPDHPEILQGALVAALALGDVPRAAQLAQDMGALGLKDPSADLALLAGAVQRRDYAGILRALSKGTSAGTLQDNLLAGWAHIGLGQMNDGLARLQKATETPGLAGFGLYHSAIAMALAGDFDSAAKLLA
jgi:Flp pilus assembly protein TadD